MINYFDDPDHRACEALAREADDLEREGRDARLKWAEAARLESDVLGRITDAYPKGRTIFTVSAASLWLRADRWAEAKQILYRALSQPERLVPGATKDLEQLLQDAIRGEELAASVAGRPYQVLDARLDGGTVGRGFAPAQLLAQARTTFTALTYRIADLELERPFRARGQSELMRSLPLFETQGRTASFGLRFVLTTAEPALTDDRPARVAERFLELAAAAAAGPDELTGAIPDRAYRLAIATAFRDLAPAPGRLATISFGVGRHMARPTIAFSSTTRERLNQLLETGAHEVAPLTGALKNVVLESKHPYIEILGDDGAVGRYRIDPETHADTIGAKVNRRVEIIHETRRRGASEVMWALDVREAAAL